MIMNININEETIEIIYQSIMGLWYYLPAVMIYKFLNAPKSRPKAKFSTKPKEKAYAPLRCKKFDKDPARTFEAKVLRKKVSNAA